MTSHCPTIVNALISDTDSYLELGINDKSNFNAIGVEAKVSVDFNEATSPTYAMTTDKFFTLIERHFDFIFIDANHDYDFVVRDLVNSIKFANKFVILHDMNPPTLAHCDSGACSDSYKLLVLLHKEKNLDIFTLNNDFGLSIIPINENVKRLMIEDELIEKYRSLSYEDFVAYRDSQIKLYETQELIDKLKEYLPL